MIRKKLSQVPETPIAKPGFQGMTARFALTKDDGCPRYAMRMMEFQPGGCTSLHAHPEEHAFYFLEGDPALVDGEGTVTLLEAGDFVYTQPHEAHQLRNMGTTMMRVICTIPILPGGDGKTTGIAALATVDELTAS